MANVEQRKPAPLSIKDFRAFVATRPDEEHWELIAGVALMTAPATLDHQRIVSNLERLLNDALEASGARFVAYQRAGLNLASIAPDYDPEPDVVVIGADEPGTRRYLDRFYLAAEIVSKSDQKTVEAKRSIYQRHPDCRCVLVIRQSRFDVSVALLGESGWTERRLSSADDALVLPDFGLRCTLADLYRGTALQPRGKR
jgi:Uma2 family endonuclease